MEGFNLGKLVKGNKEAIKIAISTIVGLWTPADPALKVVVGSALKLTLDLIDFWASKVKLE